MGERICAECVVCSSNAYAVQDYDINSMIYGCPVCGRYELTLDGKGLVYDNRLASYLYYHSFKSPLSFIDDPEYRYHTTMSKEKCDRIIREFQKGERGKGRPVHMDLDIIKNWYPKSFAERIDYILLHLNNICKHIGCSIKFGEEELKSLLFVDRREEDASSNSKWRKKDDCKDEVQYMLGVLQNSGYIIYSYKPDSNGEIDLRLEPDAYKRIDELQKRINYGQTVLVAMQFGEETAQLREAIRKGISNAGYNAVFIDEVQHNDFITPEILKYIKVSRFVVVDLTHQNNGAYFEEGYAMGLGKTVIQLCQKDTKLHFDIAQKNTIMWEKEDDISAMLTNRIKATID